MTAVTGSAAHNPFPHHFFWMFHTLLGFTTRGTLYALTLVTLMASAASLIMILLLSLVA